MEVSTPAVCPDEHAMLRVAEGDHNALAVLFDRHKVRLLGYLQHVVGDRSLAEDLVGETFLRLYRARSRYRTGTGFRPWLLTIARNLALGELRRRSLLGRVHERFSRQRWTEAAPDTNELERNEAQLRVRQALLKLPEEQRSAVVLKEYHELSYREIGKVLGCSEEAARARTYRARAALRAELSEWWEDWRG